MAPQINSQVEDLVFLSPDGREVRLKEFLGKPLLLIFLRHLA